MKPRNEEREQLPVVVTKQRWEERTVQIPILVKRLEGRSLVTLRVCGEDHNLMVGDTLNISFPVDDL